MTESLRHHGVRHAVIEDDRDGQRLDNFLLAELHPAPRSLIYRLVRTGQVRVNGRRVRPMQRLSTGDEVRIPPVARRAPEERRIPDGLARRIEQQILARHEAYLVLDKPAGMAVQAGSGLNWGLMDVLAPMEEGLRPVHRLDRATSGLLVVARGHAAARELTRAFAERKVEKRYLALLQGRLPPGTTSVEVALKKIRDGSGQRRVIAAEDGQPARSHFTLLESLAGYSLAEVDIETGRTHQIRAHAVHLGHALAGDELYNSSPPPPGLKRMFLHAHALTLPWPEPRQFQCMLPPDLQAVLTSLRLPEARS